MHDSVLIGGGVIGLSLAYELASCGQQVLLLDQAQPGRAASWAGAGIIPPCALDAVSPPLAELARASRELHVDWAARLQAETGIDNGYRRCGGVYLPTPENGANLASQFEIICQREGAHYAAWDAETLREAMPGLNREILQDSSEPAVFLKEEAQIRNPRHLKALIAACARRGVEIRSGTQVLDYHFVGDRWESLETTNGRIPGGAFCVTAGAWTQILAARCGWDSQIRPIRGQIALLATPAPMIPHVLNHGKQYLVPREDGRLLVGATEEDAGFDCRNTASGIQGLLGLATWLVPDLAEASLERTWAGLRPGTSHALPWLGRIPDSDNAFVAAGHFRSGLQLSPATAIAMRRLMLQENAEFDLTPFAPRPTAAAMNRIN